MSKTSQDVFFAHVIKLPLWFVPSSPSHFLSLFSTTPNQSADQLPLNKEPLAESQPNQSPSAPNNQLNQLPAPAHAPTKIQTTKTKLKKKKTIIKGEM
jgi:hypothetical protein